MNENVNTTGFKKKSLTKNSIFYLIYNVLNVLFPLITGIYVTKILLPDTIGQVESARNIVQYFLLLSFLGIPTYGMREVAKCRYEKNKLNKLYTELMIINTISTTIFGLAYLSLCFSIPSYRNNLSLYLIVGGTLAFNFFNNSFLFEGLEEFKYISIRNCFFKVITFVFLFIFVRNENDYLWYAFITVFGSVGYYLLNIVNSRRFVRFSFKELNLKKHIKPILFLVVVTLAIELNSLVDVTMLKIMKGNDSVAFYTYGSKIYKIIIQVVNTFTLVVIPRISFYFSEGKKEEFNILVSKTLKIIFILAIPIIIGIFFVSDYLICKIYTDQYIKSASVLKVLSFIILFSPIGYLLGSRMLLVTNNENKMIIAIGIGAIVNVLLNSILIYNYGELGAASASVASEFVIMCIYILLGRKYYKLVSVVPTILKVIVSSVIMFAFLLSIKYMCSDQLFRTIIQIIGSVLIYFLVLLILKEEICLNYFSKIINRFFRRKKYE